MTKEISPSSVTAMVLSQAKNTEFTTRSSFSRKPSSGVTVRRMVSPSQASLLLAVMVPFSVGRMLTSYLKSSAPWGR